MSRRVSRETVVKIIFQNEFIDLRLRPDGKGEIISAEDMLAVFLGSAEAGETDNLSKEFVLRELNAVLDNIVSIDRLISLSLQSDWTLQRVSRLDLAILRVAIGEMKFSDDIPESVAINEAVELAKKFSYPEAPAFINGVLGKISRGETETPKTDFSES